MFKFQYQNGKKRSSGKKFSGLQNWVVRNYKSEQVLGIVNRSKKITNRGTDFKSGKRDFKPGQRSQIGARGISNHGSD